MVRKKITMVTFLYKTNIVWICFSRISQLQSKQFAFLASKFRLCLFLEMDYNYAMRIAMFSDCYFFKV